MHAQPANRLRQHDYRQRKVSVCLGKTLPPNCVLSFLSLTTCMVRPSDWHFAWAAARVLSRVSAKARESSPLALTVNVFGPVWAISLVVTQPVTAIAAVAVNAANNANFRESPHSVFYSYKHPTGGRKWLF